jgi:hypothetical protein
MIGATSAFLACDCPLLTGKSNHAQVESSPIFPLDDLLELHQSLQKVNGPAKSRRIFTFQGFLVETRNPKALQTTARVISRSTEPALCGSNVVGSATENAHAGLHDFLPIDFIQATEVGSDNLSCIFDSSMLHSSARQSNSVHLGCIKPSKKFTQKQA